MDKAKTLLYVGSGTVVTVGMVIVHFACLAFQSILLTITGV